MQVKLGELAVSHPRGRPVYMYDDGPLPPDDETVRVKLWPTSTSLAVELRAVTTKDGFTVTKRLLETVKPSESVTMTVTVYVPAEVGVQVIVVLFAV